MTTYPPRTIATFTAAARRLGWPRDEVPIDTIARTLGWDYAATVDLVMAGVEDYLWETDAGLGHGPTVLEAD